jgi:hypothetical protein
MGEERLADACLREGIGEAQEDEEDEGDED